MAIFNSYVGLPKAINGGFPSDPRPWIRRQRPAPQSAAAAPPQRRSRGAAPSDAPCGRPRPRRWRPRLELVNVYKYMVYLLKMGGFSIVINYMMIYDHYPLVNIQKTMENPPLSIGKSTISMAIFNSFILPEGISSYSKLTVCYG